MDVERVVDRGLDAGVVALAVWTLTYHVALLTGLGSQATLGIAAVVLVAIGAVWLRSRRPASTGAHALDTTATATARARGSVPLRITLVAALVAAAGMALGVWWWIVCSAWLVAAVAGVVAASRGSALVSTPEASARGRSWPVALAWAAGLAAFSGVVLKSNPDDLFYVNYAQWVAVHGQFPLRDTIFSDLGYPMTNWPPMASYDGLVGALAHLTGQSAYGVVYLAVPPVATTAAVLALWRLLRTWRVERVALALTAALVFLLLDGTASYASPGNLFATRMWQGKVILLCLLVPMLLIYALRYAERPTWRRAGWLAVGGIAAVGLTTSAMFVVPVLAVGAAAPLLLRSGSRRHGLRGLAAMAAYPVIGDLVTLTTGGRSADDFADRKLYRFDPAWFGHAVFLHGGIALIGVAAVLLGALLVPHPAGRVTTASLAVLVGIVLVPGVTHVGYAAIGLGPTLWRLTWVLTVGGLVGVLASYVAGLVRLPAWRAVVAAGAVAALVIGGAPIWTGSAYFVVPPHGQRGHGTLSVARWLVDHARPGDVVLAPEALAVTLATVSTSVKTVAPRTYAMANLRDQPGFDYADRLTLQRLVNEHDPTQAARVADAAAVVGVSYACVDRDDVSGYRVLVDAGFTPLRGFRRYRCLHR